MWWIRSCIFEAAPTLDWVISNSKTFHFSRSVFYRKWWKDGQLVAFPSLIYCILQSNLLSCRSLLIYLSSLLNLAAKRKRRRKELVAPVFRKKGDTNGSGNGRNNCFLFIYSSPLLLPSSVRDFSPSLIHKQCHFQHISVQFNHKSPKLRISLLIRNTIISDMTNIT